MSQQNTASDNGSVHILSSNEEIDQDNIQMDDDLRQASYYRPKSRSHG